MSDVGFFTCLRQPRGAPVEPARLQDLVIKNTHIRRAVLTLKAYPKTVNSLSHYIERDTGVYTSRGTKFSMCVHTHTAVYTCVYTHCAVHTYFDWSAGTDTVPVLTGKSC